MGLSVEQPGGIKKPDLMIPAAAVVTVSALVLWALRG